MDFGPDIAGYAGKRVGLFGGKFFPPHNGHLAAIADAADQVDVLFVAVQYDEAYEAELCTGSDFRPIPPRLRERWLSEVFRDRPDIRVLAAYEKRTENWLTDPELDEIYRDLERRCGHIDVVFSGEHEYTPYFTKWLPGLEHKVVEVHDSAGGVRASNIRRDGVFRHWDVLPEPVQRHYTKRVAFCGWESSGKSHTAQHVAQALGAAYVPEYGRTYYEELGGYADIAESQDALNTAAGHLFALHAARGRKVLCVDTDLIYTQFYHRRDLGMLNPALDELITAGADGIDEWIFLEPRNRLDDDGSRYRLDDAERQQVSDQLQDLYRAYGKKLHVIDEADDARRLAAAERLVRSWIA